MTKAGLLDSKVAEWDTDPGFILEGLLLEVTERICELMNAEGVSRAELARRLGTSPAYVTRLLGGTANMTLKTLVQVAVALGKGIDVFVPSSVREQRGHAAQAHPPKGDKEWGTGRRGVWREAAQSAPRVARGGR